MIAKNTICLWFDHDAEKAARSTPPTFPNSKKCTRDSSGSG